MYGLLDDKNSITSLPQRPGGLFPCHHARSSIEPVEMVRLCASEDPVRSRIGPDAMVCFRFPFVTYTHANTLSTTSWDQWNCATASGSQVPFAWCACALCSSLQSRLLSLLGMGSATCS